MILKVAMPSDGMGVEGAYDIKVAEEEFFPIIVEKVGVGVGIGGDRGEDEVERNRFHGVEGSHGGHVGVTGDTEDGSNVESKALLERDSVPEAIDEVGEVAIRGATVIIVMKWSGGRLDSDGPCFDGAFEAGHVCEKGEHLVAGSANKRKRDVTVGVSSGGGGAG